MKKKLKKLKVEKTVVFEGNEFYRILPYNILMFKDDIDVMIEKEKKKNPNPFSPPFEEGYVISQKWKNHILMFNKFYVIPKHLLIVTKKVESQTSLLTKSDF
jgi:ATP adenylyltransferase